MDDLLVLCPNRRWQAVIEVFLDRSLHLGIREVSVAVKAVPMGGSRFLLKSGSDIAAQSRGRYHHCLTMLDADQCGDEREPQAIETALNEAFAPTWNSDAAAIVADPSLEGWLLEGHRVFSRVPGLRGMDLRRWLHDSGLWPNEHEQPDQPRHALESLFKAHDVRVSAANYRIIAQEFPFRFDRIESASFRGFINQLRDWFPS
jgi:hypothetical protein